MTRRLELLFVVLAVVAIAVSVAGGCCSSRAARQQPQGWGLAK